MAVPVVASVSTGTSDTGDVTFAAPTGWQADDLLVILGTSEDFSTNNFGDLTGWTKNAAADNSEAVQAAFYWRIADGNESFPLTVTMADSDPSCGWLLRITGADSTTPINATGSWVGVGGTTQTPTITQVTTSVADCLGIYLIAMDGSDFVPFTLSSGAGWSVAGDLGHPTNDNTGVGAQYGTKTITSTGGSGDVVIDLGQVEGSVSIQFAVAPASGPVSQNVAPTALASTVAYGSPSSTPGAVTVTPTGFTPGRVWISS